MTENHQDCIPFPFHIPSGKIPVPATLIAFSQPKNRSISIPILPLQDPLWSKMAIIETCLVGVFVGLIQAPTRKFNKIKHKKRASFRLMFFWASFIVIFLEIIVGSSFK